jgi:hypothetical protein
VVTIEILYHDGCPNYRQLRDRLPRRNDAWLKHKHRQRERLAITGWRPRERGEPEEVVLTRRKPDGTLRYAAARAAGYL